MPEPYGCRAVAKEIEKPEHGQHCHGEPNAANQTAPKRPRRRYRLTPKGTLAFDSMMGSAMARMRALVELSVHGPDSSIHGCVDLAGDRG